MIKSYTFSTEFSCAHFYKQASWSEQKNRETFGKCYSDYGHGHDYKLEVTCDKNSDELQKALSELKELLDHKHLNFNISYFKETIPTTENISLFCHQFLSKHLKSTKIESVKLFERSDLWVLIDNFSV